jgi:curved DNA-binding protein
MPAPDAKLTLLEARALLGVAPDAGPEVARRAFRAAAKRLHPDRPGGDATRFRQVVAAHRALQAPTLPALTPPPSIMEAQAVIGPLIALRGGEASAIFANGRQIKARIPAGARDGERLRIGQLTAIIRVIADADLQLRDADVWTNAKAPASLLDDGGRATVTTPLGDIVVWISHKAAERRLVRVRGAGLPARGSHPAGDLFIRLTPESDAADGPARAQLRRFAAAWAA